MKYVLSVGGKLGLSADRSSFAPEKTPVFLFHVHIWLLLSMRALSCICGWHDELCSQTGISGSPSSDFHDRMPDFSAVLPEDVKIMGSQY